MNVVYMLACADRSLYTGWTNNLPARLRAHAQGTASKYTRPRRPVRNVLIIYCESATQARSIEARLKQLRRARKLALLRNDALLSALLSEICGTALPFENLFDDFELGRG